MEITDGIEWWAGIGGEPVGPLSAADLRARWAAGEMTPSTLVWRAGFTEWKPAGDVPEVAALRPGATTGPWKPQAGSALAQLAGKELDALEPRRSIPGPSGNAHLDALTGVSPPAGKEPPRATMSAAPAHTSHVDAPPVPAPQRESSRGRMALASAAGTFAMGAAVAVALLVVFRGGDRDGDASAPAVARAASSIPAPAAANAPAPTQPSLATAPETGVAPQPATSSRAVATSEPVRASDPPSTPAPSEERAAASKPSRDDATPAAEKRRARATPKAATAERSAKTVAREEPRRARPAESRPQGTRVAMAAPKQSASAASDPLAALPPAPATSQTARSSSRDPLANLVTDDDLDRELSGGSAKGSSRVPEPAPAEASGSSQTAVATSQPRGASSAVYVPPAPGGDLPEGVSPAQINETVKGSISSLRSCIDEQRSADPSTKGTLKLRWTITGDGTVTDVRNLSPEFEGKPISRCISGVVRDIRFPASRTSGQEVVFPFKF